LNKIVDELKKRGEIKIISEELDVNLEIPHIAYVETKKADSKPILFENPVEKNSDRTEIIKKYDTPVLMNIFANMKITEELFGKNIDEISDEVEKLIKMKPPTSFGDKLGMFSELLSLKNIFPKRQKNKRGESQKVIYDNPNLLDLPILKTWTLDGGKFITMGQVYTHNLDGTVSNVGMYRLQIYNEKELGLHWQIHKDSTHFFNEFKANGKKMPVSIVIGGDPLYTWCATAPLPHGINELLLYGFVRKQPAKLVKSLSNDIWIPEDGDIVIEGFVNPEKSRIEGPFGDHTGYYTLEEEYPVLEVTKITTKKNPIMLATVVGKPPIEDKFMGYPTERIFLPLLKTTAPDLIDYNMPENGVFHNLILGKMKPRYKGHAKQFMHAFWGVGQMSFVKHAIFVSEKAPKLTNYSNLVNFILNRVSRKNMMISEGILDALDHSSPESLIGGKIGIDATGDEVELSQLEYLSSDEIKTQITALSSDFIDAKQYFTNTQNPITFVSVNKKSSQKENLEKLKNISKNHRIIILVDEAKNDLENLYMLVWRISNNIDSLRDLAFHEDMILVDATNKSQEFDDFEREWPDDVDCDRDILNNLIEQKILDIDQDFINKFQL
jgi:4-hydroxy-3-polyprenylbenzoate decarboxylase